MIIWSGFGFLVAVIGLASLTLTKLVFESFTGGGESHNSGMVVFIAMLLAAALTYGLHRLLLLQRARILFDHASGREIALQPNHSLFFIPVRWWPGIFILLGIWFSVVQVASAINSNHCSGCEVWIEQLEHDTP